MANNLRMSMVLAVSVLCAAASALPDAIAVPAFTLAQAYDLQSASFSDRLASALSRESGYTVFHHAEIAAQIDPDIIANINIEDSSTLWLVAKKAGVEYVLAGDVDVWGNQVTVLAKLFRASDRSVLLSISESAAGNAKQLDKLIPVITAKICAALPVYDIFAAPDSTTKKPDKKAEER